MYGPEIPTILSKIGIASKGCANNYKTLFSTNNCIIGNIQSKWSEVLNTEIFPEWIEKALRNMRKTPVNAYTKYILFKLFHSRIITNKKIVEMGIATDSSCKYCNDPSETLLHGFIECPLVANFWNEVESWLKTLVDPHIKLGEVEKIFGWDSSEGIINRSIITTIQIIYKNRQTGKNYQLNEVKRLLSNQMILEKYLVNTENNEIQFHNSKNSKILFFFKIKKKI